MDDFAVAFAISLDTEGVTYEEGIRRAERLTDEFYQVAEDRDNAPRENEE